MPVARDIGGTRSRYLFDAGVRKSKIDVQRPGESIFSMILELFRCAAAQVFLNIARMINYGIRSDGFVIYNPDAELFFWFLFEFLCISCNSWLVFSFAPHYCYCIFYLFGLYFDLCLYPFWKFRNDLFCICCCWLLMVLFAFWLCVSLFRTLVLFCFLYFNTSCRLERIHRARIFCNALRVSRAVTRLTVYRPHRVDVQRPGKSIFWMISQLCRCAPAQCSVTRRALIL